jgi:hypothetical protein
MEKESIVVDVLRFISDLDFSRVKAVTRYFGGMISAYGLLTRPFTRTAADQHLRQRLYEQMVRL